MKNPKCEDCVYCKYNYNLIYQPQYNTCTNVKNTSTKYCDIIRDPEYDLVAEYYDKCGSTGKYFEPISKNEKIKKHLVSGTFGNLPIVVGFLSWLFLVLL